MDLPYKLNLGLDFPYPKTFAFRDVCYRPEEGLACGGASLTDVGYERPGQNQVECRWRVTFTENDATRLVPGKPITGHA